jgi:hypothetical protein
MKTIITPIINYMQRYEEYRMKQFERTLRIRGWE